MEFYQFCSRIVLNLYFFLVNTKKLSSNLESLHISMFSAKRHKLKIGERNGHGKSRDGHGKVMEKYVVKSVYSLFLCPYILGSGLILTLYFHSASPISSPIF